MGLNKFTLFDLQLKTFQFKGLTPLVPALQLDPQVLQFLASGWKILDPGPDRLSTVSGTVFIELEPQFSHAVKKYL